MYSFSISFRALAKNSSFGFFSDGFACRQKPNVLFVRLAFCMPHNVSAKKRRAFEAITCPTGKGLLRA
jgi:hypothetical protein